MTGNLIYARWKKKGVWKQVVKERNRNNERIRRERERERKRTKKVKDKVWMKEGAKGLPKTNGQKEEKWITWIWQIKVIAKEEGKKAGKRHGWKEDKTGQKWMSYVIFVAADHYQLTSCYSGTSLPCCNYCWSVNEQLDKTKRRG
jgi:hypothetical protein